MKCASVDSSASISRGRSFSKACAGTEFPDWSSRDDASLAASCGAIP